MFIMLRALALVASFVEPVPPLMRDHSLQRSVHYRASFNVDPLLSNFFTALQSGLPEIIQIYYGWPTIFHSN
jgi:hypothetical protein